MLSIKQIMTTNVISVHPDKPIYEALDLLMKHKISGMPVIDNNGQVVGILTQKDVLRILIDNNLEADKTVDDYMTREVFCFTEDDNAIDICKFFIRSNVRRVPIVREGQLVGIVSRGNIVSIILEAKSKMSDYRYV